MNRQIAVNSNTYHGFALEDALEGIAAAGFRYIELTATKGWTEHVFPNHSFARLAHVRSRMEQKGLQAIGLSGHCNLMDAGRLPDFYENIQLASFFGCRHILSSIGEAHLRDEVRAGEDDLLRNLDAVAGQLEKHNLHLALETHGEHGSGKAIGRLLARLASPRIGLCYDTANVIYYSGENMPADFQAALPAITYIHLKDKAGRPEEWNFPALGQGRIDFPVLFAMLDQGKNASPFSVEIEFTERGPDDLAAVHQAVRDSFAYLSRAGFDVRTG